MVPKTVEKKRKREKPEVEVEVEVKDQTTALLKGFESSGAENASGEEGFQQGQDVPALPDAKKLNQKLKGANKPGDGGEPGVVYVGRIPHGFYEHEMRAYFSQFGDIRRLRLSRNRKTGQSKHYAFIEFGSSAVAKIVADTMNNYLMFGHILKCRTVPKEQIHENLWKGADKRFKKVPWSRMEGRKLAMGMGEAGWEKRIEGEKQRRKDKEEKLKAIGYDFDAPALKSVADIKGKTPTNAIAAPETEAEDGKLAAIDQQPSTTIDVSDQATINTKTKQKMRKAEKVEKVEVVEVTVEKPKKREKRVKPKGEEAESVVTPAATKEVRKIETKKDQPRKTSRGEEDQTADTRKVKKAKKASV
ncbi:MKI67 FHA domain-interacting nucleolar phosphoprotein [Acarospora aff. strigata]|nr:MKI67 FHA domain-interacting nucleolar phosphoprotein [Acarospora aff. strigata]